MNGEVYCVVSHHENAEVGACVVRLLYVCMAPVGANTLGPSPSMHIESHSADSLVCMIGVYTQSVLVQSHRVGVGLRPTHGPCDVLYPMSPVQSVHSRVQYSRSHDGGGGNVSSSNSSLSQRDPQSVGVVELVRFGDASDIHASEVVDEGVSRVRFDACDRGMHNPHSLSLNSTS